MPETPLRRSSRRSTRSTTSQQESEDDDQHSVASASSRSSRASNASSTMTPTRRSSRVRAASTSSASASASSSAAAKKAAAAAGGRGKKGTKKKEAASVALDVIPEVIIAEEMDAGDDVENLDNDDHDAEIIAPSPVKTPAKAKAKKGRKSIANETTTPGNEIRKEQEEVAEAAAAEISPLATRSARKQRKSLAPPTPAKSASEEVDELQNVQEEEEQAAEEKHVVSSPPPATPSSSKSPKKKEKEPASQSPKKKHKNTPVKVVLEPETQAEPEPEATIISTPPPATPASTKSSKKEKKRSKSIDADEESFTTALSSPLPATPAASSQSPKKKKKEEEEEEEKELLPATTSQSPRKKNETFSVREEEEEDAMEVEPEATISTPPPATPASSKSSKKKKRSKSIDADAETSTTSPVKTAESTPTTTSSDAKPQSPPKSVAKSAKKAKDKTPPKDNIDAQDSDMEGLSKAARKRFRKKMKQNPEMSTSKKRKKSEDAAEEDEDATSKASSKTPKKKKSNSKTPSSKQQSQSQPTESPKPVIDVHVHRMRFLKLNPKSIVAMASTPLTSDSSSATSSSSSGGSNINANQKKPQQHQQHQHLQPQRLAISREGGSVELLNPQERWISIGDVPGVRGREVDALVWVCGKRDGKFASSSRSNASGDATPEAMTLGYHDKSQCGRLEDEQRRLYGCSRDGTIFELDFATKRQKGVIGSGGGGVFCMASLCSRGKCCCTSGGGSGSSTEKRSCGGYFAAGCEDGTVKIYRVFDGEGGETPSGLPELVATLPSAGNAILSLTWVSGHSGNNDGGMGGSVIFAGVADGTIRRFDCATSVVTGPISTGAVLGSSASVSYRWKSTLRMTVENRGLREATKVWALEALSDGTVISGDSLGHVQIWDGLSGTMSQTFDHNESGADVLCLAVSGDENKVFASGIDSRVICIERQQSNTNEASKKKASFEPSALRKWISTAALRQHSHDVKALAICQKGVRNSSHPLEILVSGGVDTKVCTYVAKDFRSSRPKIWYNWPSLSPVSISRQKRLLAVTRADKIDIYHLESSQVVVGQHDILDPSPKDETKCHLKTISIQSSFNLNCSVISDDGRFLAASDAATIYLFSLELEDDGSVLDVRPTKLNVPKGCRRPCTALRFDNMGRLVCATIDGAINILSLPSAPDGKVSLGHSFKEQSTGVPNKSHHFPFVSLEVSPDGKWLAAARFSSGKGAAHIFTLPTSEGGSYQHWWSVPEMEAPINCIKILGGCSVEPSLAVGCSNNAFYIFNLTRRSLSNWSEDMGLPFLDSLPKELASRPEPVVRILSNPASPYKFILGAHGFFCVADLNKPVPEHSNWFPPDHLRAKRQVSEEDDTMMCPPHPRERSRSHSNVDEHATNHTKINNFTICLRYSNILFQEFISENEMVIVETPWMSVLEELPDALARRVYGA